MLHVVSIIKGFCVINFIATKRIALMVTTDLEGLVTCVLPVETDHLQLGVNLPLVLSVITQEYTRD